MTRQTTVSLMIPALALALGGCGGGEFVRPETSWMTYRSDMAVCSREAQSAFRMGAMIGDTESRLVETCMRARGYCYAGKAI